MERRKQLEHGELTRIIIGTVVAHGPIGPRELTRKLNSWGINVNVNQMGARLHSLAKTGQIDKVGRGLYEGV